MAKQPSNRDMRGRRGETFVKLCVEEMGCVYTPTGEKTPSVDGQIQLFDPESKTNLYLAVQVKSGPSQIQRPTKAGRHLYVLIDQEDILDWQTSNVPVIVVWVNDDSDDRFALWGESRFAKRGTRKLKLSTKARFGQQALPQLLEIARTHAGRPSTPKVSSPPLFPRRVREFRDEAWEYYSDWRKTGSTSPAFGHVAVTLRAWRHATRYSSSQRAVLHKLALLPCAREVLETAAEPHFLRSIPDKTGGRALLSVCGLQRSSYRANAMVEVVVEVKKLRRRIVAAKLHAFHEKRDWYR